MKTCTRWLLTLVLAAVPMMAVINTASANSELVPASRLVAPLYDISGTRNTFFLLTNVSAVRLNGAVAGSIGAVHVQFYDKTCTPGSTIVNLSEQDIDQLNVTAAVVAAGSTQGFADIDVRSNPVNIPNATSIQENVLLGEVVIVDIVGDWALSYPMASSVGSAAGGVGANIVTRAVTGLPLAWTGRYEPFATRLFVPGYYAEGGTGAGAIGTSLLSVVSPADGNWYGTTLAVAPGPLLNVGEAPGQPLANPLPAGQFLVNILSGRIWDGCEHGIDRTAQGHTVINSLTGLFGPLLNRAGPPAWASGAGCSPLAPMTNDDANITVPVGWIDLPSNSQVLSATTALHPFADQTATNRVRGLVGVLFETTDVSGGGVKAADTARLWGSRASITSQAGCTDSAGAVLLCKYDIGSSTASGGVPTSEP